MAAAIRAIVLAVTAAHFAAAAVAGDKPGRIVSMNLCADQLVILLADRDRIASVSYLAARPEASSMADAAADIPLNYGTVEEVLPLEPDLVFAGAFTTRPTVFLLRKLGRPVVELPAASSLAGVRANIRMIAEAVGEARRGEDLVAGLDADLAAVETPAETRPSAMTYSGGGFTSGGETLPNAVIEAAGFRNLARVMGLTGSGQLPLEALLIARPDLLIIGRRRVGQALANETFRHPALARAFGRVATVRMPDRLWICETPHVADTVRRLATARLPGGKGDD